MTFRNTWDHNFKFGPEYVHYSKWPAHVDHLMHAAKTHNKTAKQNDRVMANSAEQDRNSSCG